MTSLSRERVLVTGGAGFIGSNLVRALVDGPNQRVDAYGNVIPIFAFQMLRAEPLTVFGAFNVGIGAAAATLGFAPAVSIEDGLAEYAKWAGEEVRRGFADKTL